MNLFIDPKNKKFVLYIETHMNLCLYDALVIRYKSIDCWIYFNNNGGMLIFSIPIDTFYKAINKIRIFI